MLHSTGWAMRSPISDTILRYALSGLTVAIAFSTATLFVACLCSGSSGVDLSCCNCGEFVVWTKGLRNSSVFLSTICLLVYFLVLQHSWLQVARYDLATICLYAFFAWWIHSFTKSRRHLENVPKHNGEELEAAVKARTRELFRINAEYRTILEAAPLGIALFGQGRIVERCNPEYERMLGYGPGELSRQQAPLPADQREAWQELENTLRAGRSIMDYQVPRLRRDGSRFPATIWLTPLHDCRRNYTGMVGFILDSTERNAREAERQMLTTLVGRSPDLIAVTDGKGKLAFLNGAGRRLLGLGPTDDLSGINFAEQFRPAERNSADKQLVSLTSEDEHFDIETSFRSQDTDKDILLRCTSFIMPPTSPGRSPFRAYVAQDISERKEAEAKLRTSLEENRRLLDENRVLQEKLQHENISLQERNRALQSEIADIQRVRFEQNIGRRSGNYLLFVRVSG